MARPRTGVARIRRSYYVFARSELDGGSITEAGSAPVIESGTETVY
jgi:hypothetical protein